MTTTRKARARKALRYAWRSNKLGTVLPPSATIALAHWIAPQHFPLQSRRQWKKQR